MEMDSGFVHDATATWSGFIYQGYVAIYLAVKQICALLSTPYGFDKETIGLRYQLEIENWEDVSIVRDDENGRCYLSIHQVKNRNEKNISAYKKALVQLMLEKSFLRQQNLGMPKAYLHTSSEIKEDEAKVNQLLRNWKNSVLDYYHEIVTLVGRGIKEEDAMDFQQKIIEIIEKEPIELNRVAYKNLLNDIKVCVKNDCSLEKLINCVSRLVEYLDKELAVEGIDENIMLYQYDDNIKFSNGEELFTKIVEQVKQYKIITKSTDNLSKDESMTEVTNDED